MKIWRLDAGQQSLVLASDGGVPVCHYWGAGLPEGADLQAISAAQLRDVTGGMLDENPPVSLSPEASQAFSGQAGLSLRDTSGAVLAPRFSFVGADEDVGCLSLCVADKALGVALDFMFWADAGSGVIIAQTVLRSDQKVIVEWLAAPVLPASEHADNMIDFSGRWCGEMMENQVPWTAGIHMRESRVGRSDHAHFPGVYLPEVGATASLGTVRALHYGWSGGHRMIAEELPDGRRQVQFGHAAGSYHGAVQKVASARLYLAASEAGLNGCASAFQRHVREHLADHKQPRPVHYNCWEAIYFDHDVAALQDIASRAADLGAERFVLDDGWFGRRDDDTSSLGDWQVDPRKYPDGLSPLIDHVLAAGMEFGIWFEPEMVNPDSDLARAHPNWILGPADQVPGRQQLVLDMAQEEVRKFVYSSVAAILRDYPVSYVKWDHNRVLPEVDAAQTEGTYWVLSKLRADFRGVEIESCSSGGGRLDYGMLQHCGRVWLSDSNDALERQRIQRGAALFLPSCVTGSHVGPRRCHTSGRNLSMELRAWTAAQRHIGFEMDPRELTQEETETLRIVTKWWKANRDWLMGADILRLDASDAAVTAEQHLAPDGGRFVCFAAKGATSAQIHPRPLRLTGLEAEATYRVDLVNRKSASNLSRGTPALKSAAIELSGAYLMSHGVNVPWSMPETIWVLEGTRI